MAYVHAAVKENVLQLFQQHPQWAALISITISVVIAVLGIVPSVFITAANILFFGFWKGTLLSLAGEALGAVVSFYLYRMGFQKASLHTLRKFPKLEALLHANSRQSFWLIFSMRLLPFVPSGLVTFAAAVGNTKALVFLMASTLGKIPALLLEAFAVAGVLQGGWLSVLILAVVAVAILWMVLKKRRL